MELFALNAEKAAATQQRLAAKNRLTKIFANQKRLRENIKSLEKVKNPDKLMSRYLSNLEQHENEIAEEQNKMEQLQDQITEKRQQHDKVCNEIRAMASNMLTALAR